MPGKSLNGSELRLFLSRAFENEQGNRERKEQMAKGKEHGGKSKSRKNRDYIKPSSAMERLGFGFVPTYRKGERGKYQLVVSKKRLGKAETKAENHYPENHTYEF